nr:trypsin-like peptidase domain-containing protein [Amycolatopsis sulphurea]
MKIVVFRTGLVVVAAAALIASSAAAAAVDIAPGGVVNTAAVAQTAPSPAQAAGSAVGTLVSGGKHFCTASVVHSPGGDLVLTAAHCLGDGISGLTFVPGYRDGAAPYGSWNVTSETIPAGWQDSADQDLDFAFLTVAQPGTSATLESLTGGNTLGTGQGFSHTVTLTGYPDATEEPVVCTGTTAQSDTYQQRIACPGFPDGTSGGPWITGADPLTGLGTVLGVIGGYQQGGDTADVSYSAYFDTDIQELYAQATA